MVIRNTIFVDYKMLNSQGNQSLESKLEYLLASGVDEIFVKPFLMTDGFEAKRLREWLSLYEGRFSKIDFDVPILGNAKAIDKFAEILISEIGFSSEYEYLLVGHGRKGWSNLEYFQLSDNLHSKGFSNVEVACLAGEGDINSYLKKIAEKFSQAGGKKPIQVFPLLINLGVHIQEDIFGTETDPNGEKSVVQFLEENGYTVVKNILPLSHFEKFKERYLDEQQKDFL